MTQLGDRSTSEAPSDLKRVLVEHSSNAEIPSSRGVTSVDGQVATSTTPTHHQSERFPLHGRVPTRYERFVKPVIDFVGAAILLTATLPIFAIISLIVLVTMGRPFLFTQRRIGLRGRQFTMFKFRTMVKDRRTCQQGLVREDRRRVHKSHDDPRITRFGRFLRKWSLDEIPQFWNVLLLHMSLVGPRPELAEVVQAKYEPWQHQRHVVKPGITGLWQISEQKDDLMLHATQIDLEYIDRLSPLNDLRILLLTPWAALGHPQSVERALSPRRQSRQRD